MIKYKILVEFVQKSRSKCRHNLSHFGNAFNYVDGMWVWTRWAPNRFISKYLSMLFLFWKCREFSRPPKLFDCAHFILTFGIDGFLGSATHMATKGLGQKFLIVKGFPWRISRIKIFVQRWANEEVSSNTRKIGQLTVKFNSPWYQYYILKLGINVDVVLMLLWW